MGAASVGVPVFVVAALVSLGASWVLAARIERVATHLDISEALLGVIAAFAADSPEMTSAITALGHHQGTVGTGVVLGSNVFNLAALLGLSALFAGRIRVHRRVVVLSGAVAVWIAVLSVFVAVGTLPAAGGLLLVAAVLVPYVVALGVRKGRLLRLRLPERWTRWLVQAIEDEESELAEGEVRRFRTRDVWAAGAALAVVVVASVTMERAGSDLGRRYSVPDVVVGALVLAGVTSLPNVVTASYLALRGRGAAVLSIALNSNALNVAVGWLLPATIAGVTVRSDQGPLMASFYVALTVGSLVMAYVRRGLGRAVGVVIIGTYVAFVGSLVAISAPL